MTDTNSPASKKAYSINEFCRMFSICRSTYYKLRENGEIKPASICGRIVILEEEVRRFIVELQK